jgi:hypothetical protein
MPKIQEPLHRKGLFWLMVLEVSFHVSWLCCFWGCGEAVHHGGECVVEQSYSLNGGREAQRGTGRGWSSNITFKSPSLQWPNFLLLPHLLKASPHFNSKFRTTSLNLYGCLSQCSMEERGTKAEGLWRPLNMGSWGAYFGLTWLHGSTRQCEDLEIHQ